MSAKKWSNRVIARANQLASIIRDQKEVSWSRLLVLSGMGSSTLYAYKKILLELFEDIQVDGEVFRVVKETQTK